MDIIQDVTQEMGEMKLEETSHFFPQEIVHEILIKLPIKFVIRCTLVCKTWRSMIINRRFIRAHFSQNSTAHLLLIHALPSSVYYYEKDMYIHNNEPTEELCSLYYDNHAFDEYCKMEFPTVQDLHNDFLRVVGICNGLVFLADDYIALGYTFIICNPSIRKSVTLPEPHLNYSECGPYDASMGFGYDAVTNDYKVVRLFTDQRDNPTAFEVYSLARGSWSNPRCLDPVCRMSVRAPHAFVNGAIYWKAVLQLKNGAGRYFLLAFDVGTELFREVMMPKSLEHCSFRLNLSVLDGKSLAIFAFDYHLHEMCIWVMKEHCGEDSWTRLANLSIQNLQIPFISEVLCFKNTGEVVFLWRCGYGTELASLDIAGKQSKTLGIRDYKHYYANSYKETLVLLDKADAVSY